jgi:3-oxoacyl-[acyl-carrier-protein] synthase-1
MVYCIGHNIISPLGESSQANYEAVQAGRSGLKQYTHRFADVEPFCASLFDTPQAFVPLCIKSVEGAMTDDLLPITHSKDTVFILSTTKGDNLDLITPAKRIAQHFGNPNAPIVVSNACTSGVCAQITAMRLLEAGLYRHAIVIGCDIQTRFIVSGFQSFKALSPEPCKPFSPDRQGLNLGEAAATIIYSQQPKANSQQPFWTLDAGSIHNDANHLSAPSRTGEGAYRCLKDVMDGITVEEIALVGVHGTATMYNDAMETIALERAGLQDVPKSVLKPFFGHTMGAAGVVETILCAMQATNRQSSIVQPSIIKMLSGFGGVNAAIRLRCE